MDELRIEEGDQTSNIEHPTLNIERGRRRWPAKRAKDPKGGMDGLVDGWIDALIKAGRVTPVTRFVDLYRVK
jgi:hypothetical protein